MAGAIAGGTATKRNPAFTRDMFALCSHALTTVWVYREAHRSLADYACRQYGGLLIGFYGKRWAIWFDHLEKAPEAGVPAEDIPREE